MIDNWRVKYSIVLAVLASVYALVVTFIASDISSYPPLYQYFMVSFPVQGGIAFLASKALKDGIRTFIGVLTFIIASDLLIPPYVIGLDGVVSPLMLGGASFPVLLSSIYTSFGITGPLLWAMIYPLSFAILITIAIFTLSKKQFERRVL